ncbi:P-loop containing nucleoside triphosphate hydrolase protein [Xylariaceae sp. FL0016]|nr:P-loop containing nucleoside triphosphate hydrolase protein [Xylariaceae sp. FL0016]
MADSIGNEPFGCQDELDIIKQHLNYTHSATPGQQWRNYPEIPTSRDLNPDWNDPSQLAEIRNIHPNIIDRPWPSKQSYLEAHYRLQREEAISLLRWAARQFRETPEMMDDDNICVYTKVFVRGYLMTRMGPLCRIQFSTERSAKKIRWTQSRRLTTGTLVILSTAQDNFRSVCIPAIIADHPIRDGLDQNPPMIEIQWGNINDAVLDPSLELVMLEARAGYFEAVRHSMVGLQHVAKTDSPLDKYLVHASKDDLTAGYVRQDPEMNMSSLIHHIPDSSALPKAVIQQRMMETKESFSRKPLGEDPEQLYRLSKYTNLDNSQLSAVHRIISKEFAIIQGPPGTGKTFTSVQALQILLESQQRGGNVIIVAAQTNHAVDQIMVQLIKLGFNVVRLGGRAQNEDIKRYSMFNLRRQAMPHGSQRQDRDYKSCEAARKKNISTLDNKVAEVFPQDLIDPESLYRAGIISAAQLESLQGEDQWGSVSSPSEQEQPSNTLSQWLGGLVVEARTPEYLDPMFDVEEDADNDLEAEDHDVDPDDCIADDDATRGKIDGQWVPFKHHWDAHNPRGYTEHDLEVRRELKKPNLWDVDKQYRGAVYQYWRRELLTRSLCNLRDVLADNVRICKNLKINRWYKDTQCIKKSQIEIIGCTTTGLCKYRGLLAALRPRTMLIEEAAETREANILSALYGSLQQLILVGDHKQLAPNCDDPNLAMAPYNLRVSMFERLVNLEVPFTMLNMQRRMLPSIRKVLNAFYEDLQDHPVVTREGGLKPIPGMAVESFFFHHTWLESTDENFSKYNEMESEMLVRFIEYLFQNGVPASQITVLTFYRGQRKRILADARKIMGHRAPFTNVQTVDSYQGEENDIVLLSLVRSRGYNGPHVAGFLREHNRAVVSISRARRGFYIFGNMRNLCFASEESYKMWNEVRKVFESQGRFGADGRFPITCQQHGDTTMITTPEDWLYCHGGCNKPCPDKLPCGHKCGRNCHWVDHKQLICVEPCEARLLCGHGCEKTCGERCFCSCPDFRGAYPTDEQWDDIAEDADDEWTPTNSKAPGVQSQQRPNGRGRPSRRSGLHVVHGRRAGLGYNGQRLAMMAHPDIQTASQSTGLASSSAWKKFHPQQHDALQRHTAHHHLERSRNVQDLRTNGDIIYETYRPVHLSTRGTRNVGEVIMSYSSGTPSPQSNSDATMPEHAKAEEDLLSFDDEVRTDERVYANHPSALQYDGTASDEGLDAQLVSLTLEPTDHYRARPMNNPRTRVDRAEWEESEGHAEGIDSGVGGPLI